MKALDKFIIGLFLVCSFAGCKKKDDSVLTSKTWRKSRNDKNAATNPPGSVFYLFASPCELDDTYSFETNGNLKITSGASACFSGEAPEINKSYSLNRSNKELIIDGNKYTLAEETKEQLKYYSPAPSVTGFQYVVYIFE
jgi:hypothetical protein